MRQVPPECLSDEWGRVAEWIQSALPYGAGDENARDILIALARGAYTLWVSEDLAAVVQVVKWPRQSVCTLLYVGGLGIEPMKQAYEFARRWCLQNGVQVLRMHGRPGWERALGVKRAGVILQERVQ